MKIQLFGAAVDALRPIVTKYGDLRIVQEEPDVIVCYGGDGTLLSAERQWPGVPKVPIRNSRRGNRCIAHPPEAVIERMARGELVPAKYLKVQCTVRHTTQADPAFLLTAMNEFNMHMGRINSAVRFVLWLDEEPYNQGREVLGDGFVVSTPFGSTAYFSHITRGVFHAGIGLAFQNTTEHTNHVIVPESAVVRLRVTRGPAMLAHDNSPNYFHLREGHELVFRKHDQSATILTWKPMSHPSDDF
ncbi:MAG TPA: hypothetical protein PLO37_23360 [Candidatus Hydrogenedentes bacterium]|nr:hypothetical protein [Candidatus Hydrogenedentota bacterium]HPG69799.1 hypothetical protein [Candidatus Hydrogenedentota bacterium]